MFHLDVVDVDDYDDDDDDDDDDDGDNAVAVVVAAFVVSTVAVLATVVVASFCFCQSKAFKWSVLLQNVATGLLPLQHNPHLPPTSKTDPVGIFLQILHGDRPVIYHLPHIVPPPSLLHPDQLLVVHQQYGREEYLK